MKFILSALLFLSVVHCALPTTTTLFMVEHTAAHAHASCTRKDHQQSIDLEHSGNKVTAKNLETLVDCLITYFGNETQAQLSQTTTSKQKLVIVDIDETILTEKKATPTSWTQKKFIPIQPMQRLYNYLIAQGYTIAFVTWRAELPGCREKTINHLQSNGFKQYHSLHMRPKNNTLSCGQFKESVRTALAKEFDIVATLDDKWCNLCGIHTGKCLVWVCNQAHEHTSKACVTNRQTKSQQNIRRSQWSD